ncbi:DUF4185 domain-containing protein [Candidatus Micrarchaeota archaeon]|nr:DUF4185 domain-containing protein [Candidatus Micrarchaeota archaeon]
MRGAFRTFLVFFICFLSLNVAYPSSTVITDISFNPATYFNAASGSDNFPMTWADDGHQYTSWGDGGGFEGSNTLCRASLGLTRIEGDAVDFVPVNLWGCHALGDGSCENPEHAPPASCAAENPATFTGKSYGIVSIDGVLYMWVSPGSNNMNYDNARLARSYDHGATWELQNNWMFTEENELILPSISQYGEDAASPDGFVYMYATRLKDATGLKVQVPGEVDLMRVPKDFIWDRDQYEFSTGLNQWTNDLTLRQPVFIKENVGWAPPVVTYHSPSGRYLLVGDHHVGDNGGVSGSGMSIFEAPNPWGPWYTVAIFDSWDYEPSFFYNFPSKWISANGETVWLVFSGQGSFDSFNLIQATLTFEGGGSDIYCEEDLGGQCLEDCSQFNECVWDAEGYCSTGICCIGSCTSTPTPVPCEALGGSCRANCGFYDDCFLEDEGYCGSGVCCLGSCSPTAVPGYSYYWVEAEHFSSLLGAWVIDVDEDASNGEFVLVPFNAGGDADLLTYSFEVPVSGEYRVWGRELSPHTAADSVFIRMDGGAEYIWDTAGGNVWRWDVANSRSPPLDPLAFDLSAGFHTLTVRNREDGMQLDKLLITNDLEYVPSGMGEPESTVTPSPVPTRWPPGGSPLMVGIPKQTVLRGESGYLAAEQEYRRRQEERGLFSNSVWLILLFSVAVASAWFFHDKRKRVIHKKIRN